MLILFQHKYFFPFAKQFERMWEIQVKRVVETILFSNQMISF